MSELVKWFQKRRETKALETVQRHLVLTTGIVEDLEKAMSAAARNDEKGMQEHIERVANSEKEADALRRKVMDKVSRGNFHQRIEWI